MRRDATLTTLTIALVLAAKPVSAAEPDAAAQQRAVAAILKLGGEVEVDAKRPGRPVVEVVPLPEMVASFSAECP
jgi:hypothetical protein